MRLVECDSVERLRSQWNRGTSTNLGDSVRAQGLRVGRSIEGYHASIGQIAQRLRRGSCVPGEKYQLSGTGQIQERSDPHRRIILRRTLHRRIGTLFPGKDRYPVANKIFGATNRTAELRLDHQPAIHLVKSGYEPGFLMRVGTTQQIEEFNVHRDGCGARSLRSALCPRESELVYVHLSGLRQREHYGSTHRIRAKHLLARWKVRLLALGVVLIPQLSIH